MKKFKTYLQSLALFSVLVPVLLAANEERVVVGPAPDPIENEKAYNNPPLRFIFNDYPSLYYPFSCHWMVGLSAFGDSLEIEDGSVWELDPYDGQNALEWRTRDPLIITQNHTWFSKYTYKIVNKTTDFSLGYYSRSIPANLKLGPLVDGPYTHFIAIFDPYEGEMTLTNGTNLEVCPRDKSDMHHWREGHAIIIGINSGWESSYDLLLINVNTNNYVRAKQF